MEEAPGMDGTSRSFDHSFTVTLDMFMGMAYCLIIYHVSYKIVSKKGEDAIDKNTLLRGNRDYKCWVLLFPAMCDMCASTIDFVAITMTYPSSYQMIRGDFLLLLSEFIAAIQFVYEEKKLVKLDIAPMAAAGWEGVFGLVVCGLLHIPLYFIPMPMGLCNNSNCSMENFPDAVLKLIRNWKISIAFFGKGKQETKSS
ncbi:solute carrier family 35 member F6-like [Ctenocephalides felis]|uniref:solute carrier family 35 member F6-like n=1 Tax=Ctenocephalides felis TaxID=7515 RepID=UPI000E6E2069|nr:solute carrier family 35 member F6-like [Ctenocephalides felis]